MCCLRNGRDDLILFILRVDPVCGLSLLLPHGTQVGCTARFTLTQFLQPELRDFCKVTFHEVEHTGHTAEDALLPRHRRQRALSAATKDFVAAALEMGLPPRTILEHNLNRLRVEFATRKDCTASGLVRFISK